MSDPTTIARSAREDLSRALGQLQTPGAPEALLAAAEPIAAAMRVLRGIELGSGGAVEPAAREALGAVRRALGQLQELLGAHPTVDDAVEVVAGSLSLVHDLARLAGAAPSAARGEARGPAPPRAAPERGVAPPGQPHAGAASDRAARDRAARDGAARDGAAAAGYLAITADLGAHSATNFYRGLTGADVVQSGGIFVATYQIPAVGQPVILRIALPGGYEFEARGVVRWTRDAPDLGAQSPPGFGARFTDITPEGRQLVHRYVRNREPLLHDDP